MGNQVNQCLCARWLLSLLCCFQFYTESKAYEDMLKWLNIIFTALFTLECILKIIAFGLLVRNTRTHTAQCLDFGQLYSSQIRR